MKSYNKFLGIDIIRVLSMFFVILLHSGANRLRININTVGWETANILTSAATCGVPLFFMISGALILNSKNTYSIKYTLKNRLLKLFIPLFIWSCIAILVKLYVKDDLAVTPGNFISEIINFFKEPSAVHLWFMYYLIPMYLISPALKAFVDKASERIVIYILLLWVIQSISFTLGGVLVNKNMLSLVNISFVNNIGFISGYLGYFLLGWYLFHYNKKVSTLWLVLIVLAALIIIILGTRYESSINDYYTETFKSYKNIFVIVFSASVFMLLNKIENVPDIIHKIISGLAVISYGVYLSHNVIISLLYKWFFKDNTTIAMAEIFIVAAVSSIALMLILSKIKYISTIFAGIKKN